MLLERMPGVWLIDLAPLRDGSLIAAQSPLASLVAELKNEGSPA